MIDGSYSRIKNYEKQILGLKEFQGESKKGAEQFLIILNQRRRTISSSLNGGLLKHPMLEQLSARLTNAVDSTYENSVLSNFQSVSEEILLAIHRLENQIEEEKYNISYCEMEEEVHSERGVIKTEEELSK